jgi:hypothetical protein
VRKGLTSLIDETAVLCLELDESHATIELAMQDTDSKLKQVKAGLAAIVSELVELRPEFICASSSACEDMQNMTQQMQIVSGDNLTLAAALTGAAAARP